MLLFSIFIHTRTHFLFSEYWRKVELKRHLKDTGVFFVLKNGFHRVSFIYWSRFDQLANKADWLDNNDSHAAKCITIYTMIVISGAELRVEFVSLFKNGKHFELVRYCINLSNAMDKQWKLPGKVSMHIPFGPSVPKSHIHWTVYQWRIFFLVVVVVGHTAHTKKSWMWSIQRKTCRLLLVIFTWRHPYWMPSSDGKMPMPVGPTWLSSN